VNPRNFRQHRRGDIIVSLAGVGANLLIALLCVPLLVLTYLLGSNVPALASSASLVQTMLKIAIEMNLGLLFFNLVPIPPLDGSHVMKYLLPPGWSLRYQQIGRYGFLILLVLLNTPALGWWLRPVGWLTSALLLPVSNFMLPTPGVM
jgi:Zn-dependent protease